MGVYLVSVCAEDWSTEGEDGWGEIATALNDELRRQGLPPYESVPEETDFVRGSGQAFEEKMSPSMDGFVALCRAHLSREDEETICGWTVLVPFSLDETILLPLGSGYTEASTAVAGAPQVLAIAERLAAAVGLPAETPHMCDNLDLTMWFRKERRSDWPPPGRAPGATTWTQPSTSPCFCAPPSTRCGAAAP